MRIPLIVRERKKRPTPFVRIAIKSRPIPLLGLIDTGSPWTVITPMGVKILKIRNIKRWGLARDASTVFFAGFKFKRYKSDLKIGMLDDNRKFIVFDKPTPAFLDSTKQVNPNRFKEVPILIGCDFLDVNKLSLHFNPKTKIAFLEK